MSFNFGNQTYNNQNNMNMNNFNNNNNTSSLAACSSSKTIPNPNSDLIVCNPPQDSIQALKWSPNANNVAVASWNCAVQCYGINTDTGETTTLGEYKHTAPVLDVCWTADGSNIISSSCDKLIKMWNQRMGQPQIIGKHGKAIKCVNICTTQNSPLIVSGSWDKKICYWDPRTCSMSQSQSNQFQNYNSLKPVSETTVSERIYAMDVNGHLLGVALACKKVLAFDMRKNQQPFREYITTLKQQLRCISNFNCDGNTPGFAIGSIEGRCSITHVEKKSDFSNYTFKCHRQKDDVYALNDIKFHPKRKNVFASVGSDGQMNFWHKTEKKRLNAFVKMSLPITSCDWNYDGTCIAYSTSYDWSKGIEYFRPSLQIPQLYIHKCSDSDFTSNGKK